MILSERSQPVTDNDPAVKVNVGIKYEIHPMPALIRGKVIPD
jgi:hypothetical protein